MGIASLGRTTVNLTRRTRSPLLPHCLRPVRAALPRGRDRRAAEAAGEVTAGCRASTETPVTRLDFDWMHHASAPSAA